MISLIKNIIPSIILEKIKKIVSVQTIITYFFYDLKRFFQNSSIIRGFKNDKETLLGEISIDYHKLEKGLSLNNIKSKFGLSFLNKLIKNLIYYRTKYGTHIAVDAGIIAINNYVSFHDNQNIQLPELQQDLEKLYKQFPSSNNLAAVIKLKSSELYDGISSLDFEKFVNTRHSIRSFSSEIIEKDKIQRAVEIAIQTPSVCNRQPWKVYCIQGEKIKKILEYQNGNRGFDREIKNLLIVVGKLSYMQRPTERHQVFIDGGMFSMSLIYALHSLKLASCALNFCVSPKTDKMLRTEVPFNDDEEIIMYIAFGKPKEEFTVTRSQRFDVNQILNYIDKD